MGTHARSLLAFAVVFGVTGGAVAQEARPLLSGPTVQRPSADEGFGAGDEVMERGQQEPRTIVERSFEGTLVELDAHPAAAALEKLALSDDERVATDRILDERARYVSKVARENQALLLKLQTARRGGASGGEGRRELMELMREARPMLEPLVRPTLVEKLSGSLSEAHGSELASMVDEYMEAYRPIERSGAEPRRGLERSVGRVAAAQAETGLALREIARAFASTVEMRREQAETLYRAIEATPEQEAKIQQILRDVGSEEGLGAPNPAKRREIMERVAEVLTPEQRARLRTHMRGE